MQLPGAFDLSGRTAFVTGSTRGLGWSISCCLSALGATVAINGRSPEVVTKRCAEIEAMGGRAVPAACNVIDEAALEAAMASVVEQTGSLDILVANAAVWVVRSLEDTSREDLMGIFETKLGSTFSAARLALPHMKKRRWGRMIMMSGISIHATTGASPGDTASQGAMVSLTKALATKLGRHGITCNAVAPGYIRTDMSQHLQDSERFNTWLSDRAPAGRWGKPEEIGWTVAFLASDAAAYVSGQTLIVDGGLSTSL